MKKYYAGIGSRETPPEIQQRMKTIAAVLEELGWILRSGHADGADMAFESGVINPENKEIFLPWKNFNGSNSSLYHVNQEALDSVERYHPAPNRCTGPMRLLLGRDYYQVIGLPEEPRSSFIICWTNRGSLVGGTAQALRIAKDKHIPVFNLALANKMDLLLDFILSMDRQEIA